MIHKCNLLTLGDSNNYTVVWSTFFPHILVKVLAIPGTTTKQIVAQAWKSLRYKPDVIIFNGGGNDLQAGFKLNTTLRAFKRIVWVLKFHRCKKYYYGIAPFNNDFGFHARIAPDEVMFFNAHIREICKKHNIVYVDTFDVLKNSELKLDPAYTDDGIHINRAGQEKLIKRITEHLHEGKVLWLRDGFV